MSDRADDGSLEAVAPIGRGVNQRSRIQMTPEEVEAFIAEHKVMTMCTINHDGTIHAVAMWFGWLDGCLAIETKTKSQKAQNLRRSPTMTVLIEDGETYDQLRGVELVGRAEIVEDPGKLLELGRSVFERYYGPVTEEAAPFIEAMLNKRIAVKLHVDRTVSWDHRKLGG
jgi:PPOX class probable F420-dependent enzyme